MFPILSDILYTLTIAFVRLVKWIEYIILLPFSSFVEHILRDLSEDIGLVFHTSDDSFQSWTKEDDHRILLKCPYNRVIHLKVNSPNFFVKVANDSVLGFGRGFITKEWELLGCHDDFHEFLYRGLMNPKIVKIAFNPWANFLNYLEFGLFNTHHRRKMFGEVNEHYNWGNEFFSMFLGPLMQYSNAYFGRGASGLDEAQSNKLELIAEKLHLKPGMRVLEIGCGWGMLSKFLAEKHGVTCVGLTISEEGASYARKICGGLPVEIRVQDYREIDEKFDRVVSIEMIEHAGCRNYHEFFKTAHRCLKNDGLLVIQCSTLSQPKITPFRSHRWIHENVFPHLNFPYLSEMSTEADDLFRVEDIHNISNGFCGVFLEWQERLLKHEEEIGKMYGETFLPTYEVLLNLCAAIFKAGIAQSWHIVYSKGGVPNSYKAVR